MKGRYLIEVKNNKVTYKFQLKRQITLLKGDSATGKSLLVDLVSQYSKYGKTSGVKVIVDSNIRLDILDPVKDRWKLDIKEAEKVVYFIDEQQKFVYTKEFADCVKHSDCYFVIVSRKAQLKNLAYSINEIYALNSSVVGNRTVNTFTNFYTIDDTSYKHCNFAIAEDSNSGFELLSLLTNLEMDSAYGNSNVSNKIEEVCKNSRIPYVLVDGAAFGSYIAEVARLAEMYNFIFAAPESVEYLLLRCRQIRRYVEDELEHTEDYCDTKEFLTWERFYTNLLNRVCTDNFKMTYNKSSLSDCFKSEQVLKEVRSQLGGI